MAIDGRTQQVSGHKHGGSEAAKGQVATEFPRTLVYGHAFDSESGGGITLSNLFHGWDRDRLFAIAPIQEPAPDSICKHYYRLGPDEDRWIWPLSLVPRAGLPSGPVDLSPPPSRRTAGQRSDPLPLGGSPGLRTSPLPLGGSPRQLFYRSLSLLGSQDALRRSHLTPGLASWLDRLRPEVVYALFSSIPGMRLLHAVLDRTGAPFVAHMMDDWPATIYGSGALGPGLRREADRLLRSLLERAKVRIAISEDMRVEYEKRYGMPFVAVHNPVDLARVRRSQRSQWERHGGPFKVRYGGRVGPGIGTSLVDVGRAVAALRSSGIDIELEVATSSAREPALRDLAALDGVHIRPMAPYEALPAELAGADVLVMPYDFDAMSEKLMRFSMATKTAEFMASGTPVLVYAPESFAVSRYAHGSGWGVAVTTRGPAAVQHQLVELLSDSKLRENLGRRAIEIAGKAHDAAVVREQFRGLLSTAASFTPIRGPARKNGAGNATSGVRARKNVGARPVRGVSVRAGAQACPVCGGSDTEVLFSISDRDAALNLLNGIPLDGRLEELERQVRRVWGVSKADFVWCRNCSFSFAVPFVQGDAEFYAAAYATDTYPPWRWELEVSRDVLLSLAKAAPGIRILEVGAGNGTFAERLVPDLVPVESYVCTEFSPAGRRRLAGLGLRCLAVDLRDPGFGRESHFDAICMFQVLEHLDAPDATFEALSRLAAPAAHLLISVPNWKQRALLDSCGIHMDAPPTHVARWTSAALSKVAGRHGFSLKEERTEPQPAAHRIEQILMTNYLRKCPLAPLIRKIEKRPLRRAVAGAALAAWSFRCAARLPALLRPGLGSSAWFHLVHE